MSDPDGSINKLINNHSTSLFFEITALKCSSGKVVMTLNDRGQFGCRETYGSIVDCVARILRRESHGACCLSEYEINFHLQPLKGELIVRAEISSLDDQCTSFSCSISERKKSGVRLIAESSGTLYESRPS